MNLIEWKGRQLGQLVPLLKRASASKNLNWRVDIAETFRYLTHQVKELADRCCSGRLILLHEAREAYRHWDLTFGVSAGRILRGLRSVLWSCGFGGTHGKVQDPYLEEVSMLGHQDLQPHQQQTIHCSLEKVREARKQKLSMC
eukprot:759109-Hanusia_phi.AAC.3